MNEISCHHNVYVIRLSKEVLNNRKFREANPQYNPIKPCVYVGMTGLSPEERFLNHKAGHKANRFAKKYGQQLIPRLYLKYNPMSYDDAVIKEKWLAQRLRNKGYAVWQN